MTKQQIQTLNIIKFFLIYGAKVFYLNYFIYGEEFLNEVEIDKKQEDMLDDIQYDAELLVEDDGYDGDDVLPLVMQDWLIEGIREIEAQDEECSYNQFRIFDYCKNIILGKMVQLSEIYKEICNNSELDYVLLEEIENEVYSELGEMIYNFGQVEEKM